MKLFEKIKNHPKLLTTALSLAVTLAILVAAVVIMLVHPQMLGELVDAGGEDGDLHLGGAGVSGVRAVGLDHGRLFVLTDHGDVHLSVSIAHGAA